MKKAYVKVKNNSAKSILKRPYIAATIIGASLCAVILSVSMPQTSLSEEQQLKTEEQEPVFTQESAETAPPQKTEVAVPQEPEVFVPDKQETEPATKQEIVAAETTQVGLFSASKQVTFVRPVEGEIIKAYSGKEPVKSKTMGDWRVHAGIDIKAEQGANVVAPADGEVIRAEQDALTGYTISIRHANDAVSTIFNLESEDRVAVGQQVKSGDVIGTAGNSAKLEMLDDPHIHFEVEIDGELVNPEEYLK